MDKQKAALVLRGILMIGWAGWFFYAFVSWCLLKAHVIDILIPALVWELFIVLLVAGIIKIKITGLEVIVPFFGSVAAWLVYHCFLLSLGPEKVKDYRGYEIMLAGMVLVWQSKCFWKQEMRKRVLAAEEAGTGN